MLAANDTLCFLPPKQLEKLLKNTRTPLFLYDEKSFVQAAQALFTAFSDIPGFLPRFPVRMNLNPAVLRILRENGCGVICRSGSELALAARCGFQGRSIAYEPAAPDPEAEKSAHALGAVFVLDDEHLLPERMPEAAILLLRQQSPLRCDGRAVSGVSASYAGMERAALLSSAAWLRANGLNWLGVGMRLGDLCMDEAFYPAVFAQLASLAGELLERTGAAPDAMDLGGGFGVSYRPGFDAPALEACADAVRLQRQSLPEALRGIGLQMSPGRYLAAACGVLLTRVITVKPGSPPTAVLDIAPAQCMRLCRSGAYHPVAALRTAGRSFMLQQLTGSTREGPAMRRLLPELRPGDPVIIGMLGADGHSLSSTYGGAEACPEYLLRMDGTVLPESVTAY